MPTNLYGPGDNYNLETSHVIPALIRKIYEAKQIRKESVKVWGSGEAKREFLFVNDLAYACVKLIEFYDDLQPINIGTGEELTIRDLVKKIAQVTGYEGEFIFDRSMPDGTPRKVLDSQRLGSMGWSRNTDLFNGLTIALQDFINRRELYL